MTSIELKQKILSLKMDRDQIHNQIVEIKRQINNMKITNTRKRILIVTNHQIYQLQQDNKEISQKIKQYKIQLKEELEKIPYDDSILNKSLALQQINNTKEKPVLKVNKTNNDTIIQSTSSINFKSKDDTIYNNIYQAQVTRETETEPAKQKKHEGRVPYRIINNKEIDLREDRKIIDIDLLARPIKEWADIYHLRIVNLYNVDDYNKPVNEYNFAWLLEHELQYVPMDDEESARKELRAQLLYLDIIRNATMKEKKQLEEKFIITEFILRKMKNFNC